MSFLKNLFKTKDQPTNTYEDFWTWFQKNAKGFHKVVKEKGNIEKDFFDKLAPRLNGIMDGFFFLTGMHDNNTAELAISTSGVIKNFVFVEELIAAAPQIDGWKFTALIPAMDIKNVNINMSGYEFNQNNLKFYANEEADFPDEIDITIIHDEATEDNLSIVNNGIFTFLDNYLGELNLATTIDNIIVSTPDKAEKELIPISKLKDFVNWRQKEFVEKYEGDRHATENDGHSIIESRLQSGNALIAVINTDLLEWDRKASHPWILQVDLPYDGNANNGMPDEDTMALFDNIEKDMLKELKDFEGYLYIGRQTGKNVREIYFACKDFRKPSKVAHTVQKDHGAQFGITYDIYIDKYWSSFDRFIPAP